MDALQTEGLVSVGWCQWVGDAGSVIGIDRFGSSAPAKENFQHYGLTVENIVKRTRDLI